MQNTHAGNGTGFLFKRVLESGFLKPFSITFDSVRSFVRSQFLVLTRPVHLLTFSFSFHASFILFYFILLVFFFFGGGVCSSQNVFDYFNI